MTLLDVITLTISFGALVIAILKVRPEMQASGGDAAESYAAAAKTYSDEIIKLRGEVAEFRLREAERDRRIAKMEHENILLRAWAERLCFQLKSLGVTPVALCLEVE